MPLIAHSELPSFQRLKKQGETILSKDRAEHQTIREIHIGLLNMMPDAALRPLNGNSFAWLATLIRLHNSICIPSLFQTLKEDRKQLSI